ncbi:MAG: cell division protein ZapB [Spirochaetaceae bacterium]|nr:MAG: cell division protein ZapB [Spirochaetaceae bacterium]
MITVEQIRRLDARVQQAVSTISALRGENVLLKEKLTGYERRIEELEQRLSEFAEGQTEIEKGVLSVLHQLDSLEDQLFDDSAIEGAGDAGADRFSADPPEKAVEASGRAPVESSSTPTTDGMAEHKASATSDDATAADADGEDPTPEELDIF